MLAAGALIQSLSSREKKLRRQCMRAWRRFERSDAMHDTLEEIRRAGRLALKPVSLPAAVSENTENGGSDSPNQSQVARDDDDDASHSNHDSNSHSAPVAIS
jgi:hypothetical protein